ncbi:MAG: carboxypeptidase-like regulatory domain-containing protein [Thermoplasmata archaeon]|nr:carboxypeptidase-like regulatory domain-containing protein [Thermoplasmata archaeon]
MVLQNFVSSRAVGAADGTLSAHEVNGTGLLGLLYDARNVSILNASIPTVPAGTLYVGGTPHAYVGNDVNLTLGPGTYHLRLDGPAGTVTSLNVSVYRGEYLAIVLARPSYYVATFTAVGLPGGTPWSVTASGVVQSGMSSSLVFNETNGTYTFVVAPVAGYVAAIWAGTFVVNGTNTLHVVNFSAFLYMVDFVSENRPANLAWTIAIGGSQATGTGTTLGLHEPNGTFTYIVTTENRYEASPAAGTLTVAGAGASTSVSFALRPGYLTGSVAPLAAVVTIDGSAIATADGVFNVTLAPGPHTITASATGFQPFFANESVTPGNATDVPITLAALPAPDDGSTASSLPSWAFVGVGIAVVAGAVIVGGAYVVSRRHRGR